MIGFSGELVVRSELAYIKNDAAHSQSQLDPFVYHSHPNCQAGTAHLNAAGNVECTLQPSVDTGGILKRDSINYVLGLDTNQFIHFLNPSTSFFMTTQLFYRHVKGAPKKPCPTTTDLNKMCDDMVLPVPVANKDIDLLGAVDPVLARHETDQFLHTLFITTSYMSGQVVPTFIFFYDWSGGMAAIPSITFSQDPFRFHVEYNWLNAGTLKGNSGVSLLRDRDNILFQFEYVI
jgi:hypothetical protein